MKKLRLLVAIMLVFLVVGCAKKTTTTKPTTSATTQSTTSATTTTQSTTTSTTTELVKGDAVFAGVVDVTVPVEVEYDRKTGITATDYDGTDLTDQIATSGLFNYNRAGVYTITYKVTGKNGVEVTATRTITVAENALLNTNGTSGIFVVGDEYDLMAGVTAYDDEEDITSQVVIEKPADWNDQATGTYVIKYKVTGSNGYTVVVEYVVEFVEKTPAQIFFGSLEEPTNGDIEVTTTFPFDPRAGLNARDYDGTMLTDQVTVEGSVNIYQAGTYTLTYRVTGANEEESVLVRTVTVVDRYIEVDGNRYYVNQDNVDPADIYEGTGGTRVGTVTILTSIPMRDGAPLGTSNYPVVVIVDGEGRVVLCRDPFMGEYTLENPIRTFAADDPYNTKDTCAGGATTYTNTKALTGLTDADIPEGGFLMVFNMTTGANSNFAENHPARKWAMDMCRRIGAVVNVHNVEIEGYTQKAATDMVLFHGVEDVYVTTAAEAAEFAALEGVTASKGSTDAQVEVVRSTVDLTNPGHYYVLYKATLGEEEVYYTRRVIVADELADVRFEVVSTIVCQNTATDVSSLVKIFEFSRELINYKATINDGGFDYTKVGTYTITYTVTGQSGVEVSKTIEVEVTNKPVYTIGSTDVTITVGDAFNPTQGFSAVDYDGSAVTYEVTMPEELTIGTHTVTITISGKNGETVVTINLTVLGPKPTFEGKDTVDHVVNNELDVLSIVVVKDHNDTILTPTYTIEEFTEEGWVAATSVDTTKLGTYRVVYTATGEYQENTYTVMINVIDPNPIISGAYSSVVTVGSTFNPLAGVTAKDPAGNDLTSSIVVVYENGVEAVDTTTPGEYKLTYKVASGDYETAVEVTITVIAEVTESTLYVAGQKVPFTIMENQPTCAVNNSTAAKSQVHVWTDLSLLPKTVLFNDGTTNNGTQGNVIASVMLIVDKNGNLKFARIWYKVTKAGVIANSGSTITCEELSYASGHTKFNGTNPDAIKYDNKTSLLGDLQNNILGNGWTGTANPNPTSTLPLEEGDIVITFGSSAAVANTPANWMVLIPNIELGMKVQYYSVPVVETPAPEVTE